MITGIGVHDRTDQPFKITGIRTWDMEPPTGHPLASERFGLCGARGFGAGQKVPGGAYWLPPCAPVAQGAVS